MKRYAFVSVALFLFALSFQPAAQAYLDPSSGSVLIQIILGGVAGFLVLLKIYWRRIRRALGLYKEPAEENTESATAEENNDE